MQLYTEVIVAYDVADNKSRRKLREGLLDIGLVDIQKSVFWGRLNQAERKAVQRLFGLWLGKEDKALLLPARLSEAEKQGACFGYPKDEFAEKSYEIF